ncbi:TENA/THI-4/PQQC family protein [Actinopolyspora xinjiangensis]|uniref:TENA/THI-4/PQQC family protein n=1 Tax=Actinopolyspora xinjiangensis TaxID=405564 RepID=A0A1H0S6V4_9ACTN|nr:hypothetical protein [Actinopolyspora xinjiangensis]SDP36958.1 TENA/THI-4/PQQC family protein [Actinopolyspora xinjiangensis]
MHDDIDTLIGAARRQMGDRPADDRFIQLLEAGLVPTERLVRLACELYHLVSSDERSFTLLASRFSSTSAGEVFAELAQGETQARELLLRFAAELDTDEERLAAHEPAPLAHAYPSYLARTAAFGTRSDMLLALLANVGESGTNYARTADALHGRYGFTERAIEHFRFFADTPRELLDRAAAALRSGLAEGDDPTSAVRTARLVHAYENTFWACLSENLEPH